MSASQARHCAAPELLPQIIFLPVQWRVSCLLMRLYGFDPCFARFEYTIHVSIWPLSIRQAGLCGRCRLIFRISEAQEAGQCHSPARMPHVQPCANTAEAGGGLSRRFRGLWRAC